jgi:hypothetical protein
MGKAFNGEAFTSAATRAISSEFILGPTMIETRPSGSKLAWLSVLAL